MLVIGHLSVFAIFLCAGRVQDQGVMKHIKMKDFLNCILNILNSRVAKFHNTVAFSTNQVIVLFIAIRLLVLREILAKLMFADKVAFYKQVQGIVYGSTANAVILILHADIQRFNIEMAIAGIYFFQYRVPFGGFAQFFIFQVCCENFPNLVVNPSIERHNFRGHKDNIPLYPFKCEIIPSSRTG